MKRFAVGIILFVTLSVVIYKKVVVRAQEDGSCNDSKGIVTFPNDDPYGFNIIVAKKEAPENPIVVGQDEEKTGVNITVDVVSYPGSVSYMKDVCTGFDFPQSRMTFCDPNYKDGKYYYWKNTCVTENDVYRYIEGESLKVWLDPDSDTEQWLGWSEAAKGWPLRDMYPEKWSLGTWTPQGFVTVGDNGLWTEEQIKEFEAKNPGYNFLEADPRIGPLPTITMWLGMDPAATDLESYINRRVLALFGGFVNFFSNDPPLKKGECHPGHLTDYQGSCGVYINAPVDNSSSQSQDPRNDLFGGVDVDDPNKALFGGADVQDPQKALFGIDDSSGDLQRNNIQRLTLKLSNVPIDLPGKWRIGVEVHVKPATYDNGTRTEVYGGQYLYRKPDHDYALDDHYFLVYVYISTPCNSMEPDGCKNMVE
jgi:hypothetical protein